MINHRRSIIHIFFLFKICKKQNNNNLIYNYKKKSNISTFLYGIILSIVTNRQTVFFHFEIFSVFMYSFSRIILTNLNIYSDNS